MTTQEFLAELEHRIAAYDLLCHPFYKAWTAGQLTREDLREYASDYYHQVAAFPAYLSALHSRLPDGEQRRAVLRNLCDEEIEGRPHSEMWLDFAEGMGADREAVRQGAMLPAMAKTVAGFRRVAGTGSIAEALAAFYAYESQVPRVAHEKAKGLVRRYGADAKTCSYFKLHELADVEHSHVWRELLAQEMDQHPEQAQAALKSAEQTAQSLWRVLDAMEERRAALV